MVTMMSSKMVTGNNDIFPPKHFQHLLSQGILYIHRSVGQYCNNYYHYEATVMNCNNKINITTISEYCIITIAALSNTITVQMNAQNIKLLVPLNAYFFV